jgi:hypothetical protein
MIFRRKVGMWLIDLNHVEALASPTSIDRSRKGTGQLQELMQVSVLDATAHVRCPDRLNLMPLSLERRDRGEVTAWSSAVRVRRSVCSKEDAHSQIRRYTLIARRPV